MSRSWSSSISSSTSTSAIPDSYCSAPVALSVALGDGVELRRCDRVDAVARAPEQREVQRRDVDGVHEDHM